MSRSEKEELARRLADAIMADDPAAVRALLLAGADPLLEAAASGEPGVMCAVRRAVVFNAVSSIPVMAAAGVSFEASLDGDGWRALHYAIRNQKAEVVSQLVALGVDVNARARRGRTPLDIAHGTPEGDEPEAVARIVELLRAAGGVAGGEE